MGLNFRDIQTEDIEKIDLGHLSIEQLKLILKQQRNQARATAKEIQAEMLRISSETKRYGARIVPVSKLQLDGFKTEQQFLIEKIKEAAAHNLKLQSQLQRLRKSNGLDSLKSIIDESLIGESKLITILERLGYSSEQIDYILPRLRGDEEYDELREKASDIIVDYYQNNEGLEEQEDYVPENPYF